MQCLEIITGPATPVEPAQSVNSLDTVPAMQQHTCTPILVAQERSFCSMSSVMLELQDWWTVTIVTRLATDKVAIQSTLLV